MPSEEQVRELFMAVLEHVWACEQVPTPRELADWIESRRWRVGTYYLETILGRLRTWPEGSNYPLIPDDDALEAMRAEQHLWWTPGSLRGDVAMRRRNHP